MQHRLWTLSHHKSHTPHQSHPGITHLGNGDHKVVEDFLARHPSGVAAVVLDPKAACHQEHAAEAAAGAGVEVYFDPATERLTGPGFDMPSLNYARNGLYNTVVLAGDPRARGC